MITIALFVLSDVLTTKFLGQKNISSFLEATIFAMKAVISVITALAIVLMANYFTDSLSYNSLLNDIKNKTSKSPWRILNEEEYKEVSVKLIHKCFEINMIYFEQNFWEAFANFSQKDRKNSLYSFYISLLKEQPKNLKTSVELSKDEITMILAKFAQLEFKGVEIELTYNLIVKLQNTYKKLLSQ